MKNRTSKIGLGTFIFLALTVCGLLMSVFGILFMFDNFVVNLIRGVCILGLIIISAILIKAHRQNIDEMFEHNYVEAKAKTCSIMFYVYHGVALLSIVIFSFLQNADISWARIIAGLFFLLSGIQKMVNGIVLRCLEAE